MMLFEYMRRTQRILRDQRVQIINPTDLIAYVNEGRGQVAGEGKCILAVGSLMVSNGNQVYPFSAISFAPISAPGTLLYDNGGVLGTTDPTYPTTSGGAAGSIWSNGGEVSVVPGGTPVNKSPVFFGTITSVQLLAFGGLGLPIMDPGVPGQLWNLGGQVQVSEGAGGIAAPLNVRTLWRNDTVMGMQRLTPRPWPWFSTYYLTSPPLPSGAPSIWTQYAQGASGSIYVSPMPDTDYIISADCTCYPLPLRNDADPESIPYLWTDAICYYAAYLAMLSMDATGGLADKMYQIYQAYVARARVASTSDILPGIYPQTPPAPANQMAGAS